MSHRDSYRPMTTNKLRRTLAELQDREAEAIRKADNADGNMAVWRNAIRQGTEWRLRRIAVETLLRERGAMGEPIAEPSACPMCGCTDLGVYTSDGDAREDAADIVECESCKWTAGLNVHGVAALARG